MNPLARNAVIAVVGMLVSVGLLALSLLLVHASLPGLQRTT